MLSPKYLEGIADEIVKIYSQLEIDILSDMAKRLSRVGKITEATKWQAQVLAEAGTLKKDINRYIKKYDKAIQNEIKAIYNDAIAKSQKADNRIFKEALGHGVSDSNAQIMLASIQKTYSDLSRLTITTAMQSQTQFIQQANNAYMQISSGAFDYDTATKNACNNLAKEGIKTVQYNNGKPVRRTIESAVRMNILTGVNQTASTITMNNCEELNCDLVETSAHIGARPEHQAWQGRIFSLSGNSKKYPSFYEVCRPGTAGGICGINCRHSYYPYFEGLEKHYTQEDLDELTNQKVSYNGKELNRYDAEQNLRGIERNIRKYKREVVTLESAGMDATNAKAKLGQWQAKANDFVKQTELERDRTREWIGTKDGKQPKGINTSTLDFSKNLKKALKIKRLDYSKKKEVAGIKKGSPMNFYKADNNAPNPNFYKDKGYRENCQSCVVAYELRRRGWNVQTLPNLPGSMLDVLSTHTNLAWIDRTTGTFPKYIEPKLRTRKKVYKYLESNLKLNNRYTIEFSWKRSGGHIIHIYKDKSGLKLYDPQANKKYYSLEVFNYLNDVKPSTIQLLDVENCDANLSVVNKILEVSK